jgi:16S rRNA processing protein RimM
VNDEPGAARFANLHVFLLRKQVPENLDEENLEWDFFIGYRVIDQHNRDLGTIEGVDAATLNVLFIVKQANEEYLIPATDDFITRVNDEQKIICMNLPEGLIDTGSNL